MWEESGTTTVAQTLVANVLFEHDKFLKLVITLTKDYNPVNLAKR